MIQWGKKPSKTQSTWQLASEYFPVLARSLALPCHAWPQTRQHNSYTSCVPLHCPSASTLGNSNEKWGGGIWPGTLYRHIVSLLMASLIKLQVVLQKELRSAAGSREREGESQRGVLDPPELLSKSSLDLEFKTAGCFKALSLSP